MQYILCKIYFWKVFHKYYNSICAPICTKFLFLQKVGVTGRGGIDPSNHHTPTHTGHKVFICQETQTCLYPCVPRIPLSFPSMGTPTLKTSHKSTRPLLTKSAATTTKTNQGRPSSTFSSKRTAWAAWFCPTPHLSQRITWAPSTLRTSEYWRSSLSRDQVVVSPHPLNHRWGSLSPLLHFPPLTVAPSTV
jgi:hypothetical protein